MKKSASVTGIFLSMLLAYAPATFGEELVAVLDPAAEALEEVYKDDVPVSGRVVAGLSMAGVPLPGTLALLPRQDVGGGQVCVQVMSRDGRYWAENNFLLPGGIVDGPVRLQYESRYSDELNAAQADDLALLSYLGGCGDQNTREYVLTSRDKLSDGERSLVIYVNSARADTYAGIVNRAKREKPQKCRRITEGRRTGYDTICRIALQDADAELGALQVKVFRRKYEKNLKPVELRVILPV
jgi:hypothetical protein